MKLVSYLPPRMDPDILTRLQSLNLKEEEEMGFHLEHSDITVSREECQRSLIGKVYDEKIVNFTGLKNTLTTLWSSSGAFKIRELGVNMFQFVFFANRQDMMKVLNGKAWTFDAQFIVLKQWREDMDFFSEKFNKIHIWIQVWNLPPHWISRETGLRFKHIFSDVLDVLIPEGGSKKGRHLKILAELDLDKPLLRGTKLRFQEQAVWIDF